MSKNVLFITEGEHDSHFLEKLLNKFRDGREYEVFVYKTSIHQLLERLEEEYGMDDDIEFMTFLKGCKTNKESQDVLDRKFTDIFLVFDMDPHHTLYDPKRLRRAIELFDDSTVNGKLYLNYPMLESYKHIPDPNTMDYLDLKVTLEEIKSNYKGRAANEGSKSLMHVAKIDEDLMKRIVILNLMKSNMMVSGKRELPDSDAYASITGSAVLEIQEGSLREKGWIYVLNTSVFIVVDYSPKSMLGMLRNDYIVLFSPVD